jgi:hypothetical protein
MPGATFTPLLSLGEFAYHIALPDTRSRKDIAETAEATCWMHEGWRLGERKSRQRGLSVGRRR